jgi:hypothetical protein
MRFSPRRSLTRAGWADHNLKPRKIETFKISNDPHFEEKPVDVVGLNMSPPRRAVVFSFGTTALTAHAPAAGNPA